MLLFFVIDKLKYSVTNKPVCFIRSVGHFATDICTIIGGVFAVAGIIDSLLYRSSKLLQQKLQIGKAT